MNKDVNYWFPAKRYGWVGVTAKSTQAIFRRLWAWIFGKRSGKNVAVAPVKYNYLAIQAIAYRI